MELHQGHHALHPRRGGPVREALLVSRPHSDEKSPRCHERIKIFKKSLWGGILSETAATSPECCSSPPASSSKSACRRAATNSGKAPMTARRRMRSGKEGILKGHYSAVYVLHVLIYVFLFILLLNMFKKNKIKLKLKALGHRDEPVAEGAVPRGEGAGVQGPRLCQDASQGS